MIMPDIIAMINQAAAEGYDQRRIQVEFADRMAALRDRLPSPLGIDCILKLIAHPEQADAQDVDCALSAIRSVIRPHDDELQAEFVTVNLLAARLGASIAMGTLGQQVSTALRRLM